MQRFCNLAANYFHPISISSWIRGVSHLLPASRFDRKARDMQQKYELRMKTIREEMDAWIKARVGFAQANGQSHAHLACVWIRRFCWRLPSSTTAFGF